ncbi:hypothetical protein SAMN05421810_111212 [Amycolatopsis arida]|uniref:Uncharacterized protein n=1 Tax=Amycolatopsis arida TaxID=587909 RepID=A0A1I6AA02_9PSEU|nr:hypothetical protein [Amycolatopsis arida]TDX88483.1 hypothetical protein CLV69_1111 [Amycolatopsis arida]SFQ65538.1 hypothetical protein SAMN05421810_111212 [Amycolatopsis arida]
MSTPEESDDERRARGRAPEPRLPGDPPATVDPPTPVNVAFGLWIASGLVMVIGYLVVLMNKEAVIAELVRQTRDARITEEQIASGTTTFLWAIFIGAMAFAGLFALFGYKAREGTRSARTVLTVLAAVTIVFQFTLFGHRLIASLSALLAIIALVLMYLPSVRDYFPKVPKSLP